MSEEPLRGGQHDNSRMIDDKTDKRGRKAKKAASEKKQVDDEERHSHPSNRIQIRNSLVSLAQSFINRWDEFANRETRSNKYGFNFVARQTEFEGLSLAVTKASVPGLKVDMHQHYRENIHKLTPLIDEKITMVPCPDYEGCKCYIQQIKMPMMMTNRSIPVLYYIKKNRDGSLEFMSSSRGTDEIIDQQDRVIKSNVIGNNVINYTKLTPTATGCDWVSVICVDIAGSIPDFVKQ